MNKKLHTLFLSGLALFFSGWSQAQLIDGHAYMIGDYVEIGISEFGHEGAPVIDEVHATHPTLFGFVANPAMDDWVEVNGDFFVMGSPENGFGLEYTVLGENYTVSNNAAWTNEIPGEITSFVETTDSVITTWVGASDDLQLTIVYELKKDQHFYTTSITLENLGDETFTDVYYYRNIDPDNNQSLGWTYVTYNDIISQSEMDDDSVIVGASQFDGWDSEVYFQAYGPEWKGFVGGFSNRDGSDMWNGVGAVTGVEGTAYDCDCACGLAYKIASIAPAMAKAEPDVFSFVTAFKPGIDFSEEDPDTGGLTEGNIDFSIFPNPSKDKTVQIQIDGAFDYTLTDIKGSVVANGQGNGLTQLDFVEIEKGIYFLQIGQENKVAVEKLVFE